MKNKKKNDEIWVMKDGRKIFVSDMTETHAKNILRMLIRKRRWEEEGEDEQDIGAWIDAGEIF